MAAIRDEYDIIIVGGRVAGSATAITLAGDDYRILLIERAQMPSDTLSTHFLWPDGTAALQRFGVLDRVLETGLPKIHYFQSWDDEDRLVADLVEIDGVNFGICPRRTILDGALFEAAAGSPKVDALDHARVVRLIQDEDRVAGVVLDQNGEERRIRSRLVVGADGRNSLVAREVGAEQRDVMPPGRYWYYGYFEDATPPDPVDAFIVSSAERDFIGSAGTNDGLQMVLYGAYNDDFDEFRKDHERLFVERVMAHPAAQILLGDAKLVSQVSGIAGIEGYYRQAHGPGWVLVGDAVHQKDPIAGRGVNEALRGAEWLASALADGISSDALDSYAQQLREITWPKYQLAHIAARPDLYRTDSQAEVMEHRIVTQGGLTEFMRLWYDDRATFDAYFSDAGTSLAKV